MKRLFCLVLAALLSLCACQSAPRSDEKNPGAAAEAPDAPVAANVPELAGYDDFCDALAAKLIDGSKNRNLSPISVYLALAMTAEGAEGETQAAMLRLLGCDTLESLRGVCGAMLETLSVDAEESTLAFADSIWMNGADDTLTFREDYLTCLSDVYRSEARMAEFGTAAAGRQIAEWIALHTNDKIELVPELLQFDPDTVAVLLNTVFLKDAWRSEFPEDATEQGTFYGTGGECTAAYMNRRENGITVAQGDGFLRCSLPLQHIGRMTFVLPDEDTTLSALLGSPERIRALLHDGGEIRANVRIKLPKFQFQDRIDLNETLQSLGIGIAFSGDADFSGMGNFAAHISNVLQESYIGVDEKGVEAAAYTEVVMSKSLALPEELPEIDFFLTRPFLYAIEANDGTVLFLGTVTVPGSVKQAARIA